jgi:hypothetical protein
MTGHVARTAADDAVADRIIAFLREVGIPVVETCLAENSFLPGVLIRGGTLWVDRDALRWPGDLLHEAGHIAVTPAALRPRLDAALETESLAPHAGEVEATAWAFAAVVHLQLDAALLFHDGGYGGHAAGLRTAYALGVYPGAFGLAQAGLARIGEAAAAAGVAPYPSLVRWLRD